MDPEVDPKTLTRDFDGFRWARLRKETGNDTRYLSVATGYAWPSPPDQYSKHLKTGLLSHSIN